MNSVNVVVNRLIKIALSEIGSMASSAIYKDSLSLL